MWPPPALEPSPVVAKPVSGGAIVQKAEPAPVSTTL